MKGGQLGDNLVREQVNLDAVVGGVRQAEKVVGGVRPGTATPGRTRRGCLRPGGPSRLCPRRRPNCRRKATSAKTSL